MSFESLAFRYCFTLNNFPDRWLPLIHLFDPDLPLFPIYYFHALSDEVEQGHRPLDSQRVYGYVERINGLGNNRVEVSVVTNKDLSSDEQLERVVLNEVLERFGLQNPVTQSDVQVAFAPPMDYANHVLSEIWHRVISNAYGNKLPFGRLWDEILGLTRFVASWNSPSGRKGELIQTHYFSSKFGVRLQSSGELPQIDFYLLPTIKEVASLQDPLTHFPAYAKLINIASRFQQEYCSILEYEGVQLSKFNNPYSGRLNTEKILRILQGAAIPPDCKELAIECFNTFDKGPQRTVIFLMLLDDIRQGRLNPSELSSTQCGSIYDGLRMASTYQSPKAIQIYAQQSFGNASAMPIDTWVETFLKWPLKVWPVQRTRNRYRQIFACSQKLGRVERLIWVTSQARKVHSSACDDALWCMKYSSSRKPRGANPLACNICLDAVRNCCPAYDNIKDNLIYFNNPPLARGDFVITTSGRTNAIPNQNFISCKGKSIFSEIIDDFSPADDPNGFEHFPAAGHNGEPISVSDFVRLY